MASKAERAIVMAAGKGIRLNPLTLTTPKPLIEVNGKRMIESIIEALHLNRINEIYIVTGYKRERFNYLLELYNDIELLENPYYEECNNISSLYVAREHINNCIILDGDQMINNPTVLNPKFEKSGYCSEWTSEPTTEWLQQVKDGKVISCSRDGGKQGWQLYGVSFWNEVDGRQLQKLIRQEFINNANKNIYWDDVAMFLYSEQFELGIREINAGDIIEIDSLQELKKIDKAYSNL